MKRFLLAAAMVALPSLASATGLHVGKDPTFDRKLIDGVACNASEANRTFTLTAGLANGFGMGVFQFDFTHNAATAIAMTCHGSLDAQTTWAELQSCSVASGACTSSDASWSKAVSADDDWMWRVDFLGAPDIKCIVTCTSGGASDTFTVYGRLSTL